MYTMTKRGTVFALALLMLVMSVFVPIKKAKAAFAYNNTMYTSLECSVNSSGKLYAYLDVNGIKGTTTHIAVELFVEKRTLGIFWSKVNIGYPNNIWTDSVSGHTYSSVFNTQLNSTGTYRVTVTYTVSGNGGSDDVITSTKTVTY